MSAYMGQAPESERPVDWRLQAACRGLWKVMHPENNEREILAAKTVCMRCPLPVRVECFWDAVRTDDNEYGIRAGLRAGERRSVIRELRRRQTATRTTA